MLYQSDITKLLEKLKSEKTYLEKKEKTRDNSEQKIIRQDEKPSKIKRSNYVYYP